VTAELAEELAAFLPHAASLTPAELAECAAQPEPEPAPKAVGLDVDFAGAGSALLKALAEDSSKDSLIILYSSWSKSLAFRWRETTIAGVTAVKGTDNGLLLTTAAGTKLVRPVAGAKAEVIEVPVEPAAGPSPVGEAIAAYLGR